MLYTYIFSSANIVMGIFRKNDFASDWLLLELVSFESIYNISMIDSAPSEDNAIIALALYFVRLSLYAVNGKQVPSRHRAVYIWSAALLLTSLIGVSEITKRNIIAEDVPFVFLVLMEDINKSGLASIKVKEHTFGIISTMIREFTPMEFVQLIEKTTRRLNLIFRNGFGSSRNPQK